jgi:hypothetical protein
VPPRCRRTSSASEKTSDIEQSDHRAARWQPRHLLVAGVGQREKRGRFTYSALGTSRRISGLIVSAPRNIVSRTPRACNSRAVKTWPRSRVGAELDLVDREELDRPVERHRLDGADKIGRVRRQDLFLAGDQRHRPRATPL